MEEDIKILEMDLEDIKYYIGEKAGFDYADRIIKSIQNLIARYKELEEENLVWKSSYFFVNREIEVKPKTLDFISKSKVKEKIEKLDKLEKNELKGVKGQDRYSIKQEYMFKKNILQELLED